ncbi:MAG: lasso peptide isopeptide bond-forming cyclase [Pleurocapsa sp.]
MSAIMGLYYPNSKPVEPGNLQSMLDVLAHRGVDASNIWVSGKIGIGHRMLWTTPESLLEKLPFRDAIRHTVITADARIDNRAELISRLKLTDIPAEKITDTRLILEAYYKWGEQCPQKLLGDFAFAIWDERKEQLFCARDPMGIKPFYYYYAPNILAFASEIKALFCIPEIPQKINELKIAYQLAMFCEDQEATYYQNVFRLPSAHFFTIDSTGKLRVRRYWSLDINRRIKLKSHQEYTEAFKEIFFESVRCRLRSAFPVGSTLSGGLDSSSIACTANYLLQKSSRQKLHTFSAIFPSLPEADLRKIDERYYMKQVQVLEGIQPHEVRTDLLNPLLDWLWQEEEPILSPNIYIHDGLYNCAHENGVRVFLDGVDGDSTISHGWRYLTTLTYTGRWYKLYREIGAAARNLRISRKLLIREYCKKPLLSEPWDYIKDKLFPSADDYELVNPIFAQKVDLSQRIQTLSPDRLFLTAREEHWLSLTTGLYPFAMEIADKATAKKSLEARYPFFDRRLMEFCLAIPLEQKFRQGYPRAILRHAMNNILPPEIQWRVSKGRLGSNFQRNLLNYQSQILEGVVSDRTIEPYVNMSNLNSAYNRYGIRGQPDPGDDISVFNSTLLSLWLNNRG